MQQRSGRQMMASQRLRRTGDPHITPCGVQSCKVALSAAGALSLNPGRDALDGLIALLLFGRNHRVLAQELVDLCARELRLRAMCPCSTRPLRHCSNSHRFDTLNRWATSATVYSHWSSSTASGLPADLTCSFSVT